jgi:hypothetical protein
VGVDQYLVASDSSRAFVKANDLTPGQVNYITLNA